MVETTNKRTNRGLTAKRWRFKKKTTEEMSAENAFIADVYETLSGYEDKSTFHSILSRLIRKHNIDVVNQKMYDRNGCRFIELLISSDDNEFYTLEFCFG